MLSQDLKRAALRKSCLDLSDCKVSARARRNRSILSRSSWVESKPIRYHTKVGFFVYNK